MAKHEIFLVCKDCVGVKYPMTDVCKLTVENVTNHDIEIELAFTIRSYMCLESLQMNCMHTECLNHYRKYDWSKTYTVKAGSKKTIRRKKGINSIKINCNDVVKVVLGEALRTETWIEE